MYHVHRFHYLKSTSYRVAYFFAMHASVGWDRYRSRRLAMLTLPTREMNTNSHSRLPTPTISFQHAGLGGGSGQLKSREITQQLASTRLQIRSSVLYMMGEKTHRPVDISVSSMQLMIFPCQRLLRNRVFAHLSILSSEASGQMHRQFSVRHAHNLKKNGFQIKLNLSKRTSENK